MKDIRTAYRWPKLPGTNLLLCASTAIYFDDEGHVIHYDIATPGPDEVVFLSEPAPGPRFRLTYRRDGASMAGKFQMQAPGQQTRKSYLE